MPYCVYIMANKINTVLYTGFSSILPGRVLVHKDKVVEGFTKKYNVNKLVYYETCDSREGALWREKQIKSGSRQDKIDLINRMNPEWRDLYDELETFTSFSMTLRCQIATSLQSSQRKWRIWYLELGILDLILWLMI